MIHVDCCWCATLQIDNFRKMIGTSNAIGIVDIMLTLKSWYKFFNKRNVLVQKLNIVIQHCKKFLKCNCLVVIVNFSLAALKLLMWYCDTTLAEHHMTNLLMWYWKIILNLTLIGVMHSEQWKYHCYSKYISFLDVIFMLMK